MERSPQRIRFPEEGGMSPRSVAEEERLMRDAIRMEEIRELIAIIAAEGLQPRRRSQGLPLVEPDNLGG